MRTLLGALLALLLALSGCGDDEDVHEFSDVYVQPIDSRLLALVPRSGVGGEDVGSLVRPLDTPQDVADFAALFTDDRMGAAVTAAARRTEPLDGTRLAGAVVAVGCEPPTEDDVRIERGARGVRVVAAPVRTDKRCLVPVTTVALVAVDEDEL